MPKPMPKPTLAIVYFTVEGTTAHLAKQIHEGASSRDIAVELIEIQSRDIHAGRYQNEALFERLAEVDGIVFGSPTYMGSVTAQYKAFMDASSPSYAKRRWRNKLAAGFTMGGCLNGEQQQALMAMFVLAAQHGMLWAGLDVDKYTSREPLNRTGSNIGLVASYEEGERRVHDNDLATAFYFGQRLADLLTMRRGE